MIRILIGGILCACSMYIGYGIRKYYSTRAKFYRDLVAFIERLIDEISFMKPPLKKILAEYAGGKGEFNRLINNFSGLITGQGLVGGESLNKAIRSLYMNNTERELLGSMLLSLGTLDSSTQLHNLSNYKSRFVLICSESDKKRQTVGNLAFKLGVLMGILAMIMVA